MLYLRKELHLNQDSERVILPHAYLVLHKAERKEFCN